MSAGTDAALAARPAATDKILAADEPALRRSERRRNVEIVPMNSTPRLFPWLNRPNPVPAFERGSLISPAQRGPRFGPFIGHSHVRQPQPDPGAQSYAYEGLGLVEFSPIGWGTANRDYLFPLSTTQTLFASASVRIQGLGGLVHGQVISQPLIYDPALQSEDLSLDLTLSPFGL